MKRFSSRFPWLIPAVILTVLLVLGARAHPLWGDEAETGIYGRNILTYGIPKGWDGVNLMGFDEGATIYQSFIENSNPWTQYYLAALSFKLFGISSFTARLPFLLFGVGSLILLWYLVDSVAGDRSLATLTAIKFCVNVALILYLFQARYFSLVFFLGLLFIWSAFNVTTGKPKWIILLIFSGILGTYSQPVSFAVLMPSVCIGILWSIRTDPARRRFLWQVVKRFIGAGAIIAIAYLPWVVWMRPFDGRGYVAFPPIYEIPDALKDIFVYFWNRINETNTLPVLLYPFVVWYFLRPDAKKKRRMLISTLGVGIFVCLILSTILDLVIISDSATTAIRYHVILFPMLTIVAVGVIQWVWEQKKWLGGTLYIVYIATTLLTVTVPSVRMNDYLGEVLHPYTAPDEAVAAYLAAHAKDRDTAYINLDRDHEPLVFLLNKKIRFVNRLPLDSAKFFPASYGKLPRYIYHYVGAPTWIILYSKRMDPGSFETFDILSPPIGVDMTKLSDLYDETILPIYFSDMTRPELNLHSFTAITPAPNDRIFI